MAKESFSSKKGSVPQDSRKVHKKRRSHSREPEETTQALLGGMPGLSNRLMQRILPEFRPGEALSAQLLRDARGLNNPLPTSVITPQVLRQMAEEAQAEQAAEKPKVAQGTVTIRPVQFDYYDVTGNTLDEVAGQLDPNEWGHCQADYNYSYSATGGRSTRVNVTLTLTIRLPRWRGRGWQRASPQARQEWNRMLEALRAHEDGHAEIARRWAPIFKERLFDQDEGSLAQEGATVEAEAQAEQDQFDVDTAHGQNTGVSLDTSIQ